MKVLFLYSGVRKKIYDDAKRGTGPDTELLGLNYMEKLSIDAEFLENNWTNFFRKISFQLTQIPALLSIRKYDIVYSSSGLLLLFFIKKILRWKKPIWIIYNNNLSRLLEKKHSSIQNFIIKKSIASADAIVSPVSPQLATLEKHGFDTSKSYFVPCSIDTKFCTNRPNGPRVIEKPYVLSIGRDLGRDYPTLLKAVEQMNIPVIIGAMERNFPKGTIFPKNVSVNFFPKDKIPTLLHDAEFVIVPVFKEERLIGSDFCGQYSILEAMTAGKTVITSAFSDVIINGENGITVPPENPEALQKAILYALENPERIRQIGIKAKQTITEKYTTEKYAEELAKIFKKIVTEKNRWA